MHTMCYYQWLITLWHMERKKIGILLPIATLPAGHIEYLNPQESEGIIRTSFVKKRGVYLWTNKINGKQYIGSAMNLSSRLSDYYTNSYLKYQSTRGSLISAAI